MASDNSWITAAIGPTGAIVVIVALLVALARVLLAGAGSERPLALERWMGALSYPLAALAVAVIVVRFGHLAV